MKSDHCYFVTAVALAPIRSTPSDRSEMVTQMIAGERCRFIQAGEKDWIEVELVTDSYRGWCDRKQLALLSSSVRNELKLPSLLTQSPFSIWVHESGKQQIIPAGAHLTCDSSGKWRLGEQTVRPVTDLDVCFSPCKSPIQAALNFLGAPYLWGGKSVFGIDCSGLIQLAFALNGIALPRDASVQIAEGIKVKWIDRERGDLAFFSNSKGEIIHVGILEGNDFVLHAAGEVRIDQITAKGIRKDGSYTHSLFGLKRIRL